MNVVAALLQQAGREADSAAEYTRGAQRRLLEGGLLGIVRNMERILVKLDADHTRIDTQYARVDSLRAAAATVDGRSQPQAIIAILTPVAAGINSTLHGFRGLDAELVGTQELTGEVLVGGAPQHCRQGR